MNESALGRFDELTLHLKSTIEALIIRAERAEQEAAQLRTELDRARRRSLANPGIVGVRIEGKRPNSSRWSSPATPTGTAPRCSPA